MALWPFRTRGHDKRSSGSGAALSAAGDAGASNAARSAASRPSRDAAPRYSFSPDRPDAIHVARANRANPNDPVTAPIHSLETRVPTLHHKRSGNQPSRRKSSKRKRQDPTREAEIRAMTVYTPARATTDTLATARSVKHDNKRAKTLATLGARAPWDSPTSDASPPMPISITSRLSSDSNYSSYRVTALDALAPRPTLKYQGSARLLPSHASVPTRSESQKKRLDAFPEETIKAHKRIDDLADDFDAGELRELMERDKRRRERSRQSERDKAERRLARKAEKQKREEENARQTGTPPPENLDRGVMGREVGLGIDPPSTVVTSSKQRTSPEPMSDVEEYSQTPDKGKTRESPEPLQTFHRIDTAPRETELSSAAGNQIQVSQKPQERLPAIPPAIKREGIFVPKISTSGSTFDSDKEKTSSAMDDSSTRKDSESSNKSNRISFSIFRWGKSRRSPSGPSSFANTSREEMGAAQAQARSTADSPVPSFTGNYLSKPASGPPKRMRSRFREDLPELPISPPQSRVQSPEAEASLPSVAEYRSPSAEPNTNPPTLRDDTPTSGHRSISIDIPQAHVSRDKMYGSHSAEPQLSMSLASVDSEGSWLSGRVGSQRSKRMSSVRDSRTRSRQQDSERRADSPSNSAHDDLEITEDDYMSRLSPDPTTLHFNTRLSGEGRPSSDEDELMREGEVRWGAVGAQAQFVQRNQNRDTVRSREGLLNIDSGDEEDQEPISPISQITPSIEKADLQRASSVRVNRPSNVKLLKIQPRASTDDKRKSQENPNGA
ncbi:hypothetical protein TGAM01_v204031 [Trichoderma gamsii]|uniref:Uncharacterized protein n=1 Tax=Trichoderma gamsii TaxID=398673 RepID=A0A2P4ZS08_9HYPO|nr:hypothetical protein TGAM01_v204031 [Trichoderma gamsii]PON27082.1 hypothetical protein TGAM01_v204031 [Trichoderma gamsii]